MHYIKYIPFVLVGISFLLAVYFIFTRDHLLKFVVGSMSTDGKPDSKKLSGFVMVVSLVAGFFVSIYYAKDHLAPEFYVFTIAGLVASFYGIREVGRFVNNKYGVGETPVPHQVPAQQPVAQPAVQENPAAKKENHTVNPDEIG